MKKYTLNIINYISQPYWPEQAALIDIQKKSGVNRTRSEDKKDSALMKYLEKLGLSMDYYRELETKAKRPWHKNTDGYIVIPSQHLTSCLVAAADSSPPAGAKIPKSQVRSLLTISDFVTPKKQRDRTFDRFVVLTDGKGNTISNQRKFQSSEVIESTTAVGTIEFDENDVKPATVEALLRFAGKYIGTGSARSQGYGRFTLK